MPKILTENSYIIPHEYMCLYIYIYMRDYIYICPSLRNTDILAPHIISGT